MDGNYRPVVLLYLLFSQGQSRHKSYVKILFDHASNALLIRVSGGSNTRLRSSAAAPSFGRGLNEDET
jgi:hypothetical protein